VILGTFVIVNLSFFVFNMIPYPPLDGSRLLYAFAPEGLRKLMRTIEQSGLIGLFVFLIVAYSFLAPLIGRAVSALWLLIVGQPLV